MNVMTSVPEAKWRDRFHSLFKFKEGKTKKKKTVDLLNVWTQSLQFHNFHAIIITDKTFKLIVRIKCVQSSAENKNFNRFRQHPKNIRLIIIIIEWTKEKGNRLRQLKQFKIHFLSVFFWLFSSRLYAFSLHFKWTKMIRFCAPKMTMFTLYHTCPFRMQTNLCWHRKRNANF